MCRAMVRCSELKNKMATNLLLMEEDPEALELSRKLGFAKTLFLGKDFVLVRGKDKKELLEKIKEAKRGNLLVLVKPDSEELLRFVLEKTTAELVFGQEAINFSDSLQFPRSGLDQITCQLAYEHQKRIGFSFREILEAEDKAKILRRMMFNLKLCQKYKVKVFFSSFSEESWEMRSAKDLRAFLEVLGCQQKSALEL